MPEQRVQGFLPLGEECRRFDVEVAAYLDGEPKPTVFTHARECPFCGAILADLELIRTATAQMPLEEPPARVWANIRVRLESEGILRDPADGWRRWLRPLGRVPSFAPRAALACLAILGSILVVPPRVPDPMTASYSGASPQPTAVAATASLVENGDLKRTVEELEKSYKAATFVQPAVKAAYEKSLECLDTSIQECLYSVQKEGDNDLAQDYLRDAYTRKAEVLAAALEFDTH